MTTFKLDGQETIEVQYETLRQLVSGGAISIQNPAAVLKAIIGATNFTCDSFGKITFHFKLCKKANIVSIELNDRDLYTLTFFRYNKTTYEVKEVKTILDVYGSDLPDIFRSFTGLDTHL